MAADVARRARHLPLLAAIGGVAMVTLAIGAVWYYGSPRYTDVGYRPAQPVAYSHRLHAGEMQIDCLFCHATVDRSPVAVVPPTKVCMNCHTVVKRDSPALAPIRDSLSNGRPMRWVRVHDLPAYVHFDHRPHLRAGVGCATCHGRIDEMEVVALAQPLSMGWCLDCHRDPDPYLRLDDEITTMDWSAPKEQAEIAARIKAERHLRPPLDCTGCHR